MNSDLVEQFEFLHKYYQKSGDRGRAIAYRKIAVILKGLDFKITSIDDLTRRKIPGIGPKTIAKIKVYFDKGVIPEVQELKQEYEDNLTDRDKTIALFQNTLIGVGPRVAAKFYDEYKYRTIEDVKTYPKLTAAQKIGLKYYDDLQRKIPRKNIQLIKTVMQLVFKKHFPMGSYRFVFAGSYRRGKAESGDIDCLMTTDGISLHDIVDALKQEHVIYDTLSLKNQKFMGVINCPGQNLQFMRLDIQLIPTDQWGSALLYFTGSKDHNVYMRGIAKSRGWLLNEHGLVDETGQRLDSGETEEEIFDLLNIPYKKPEQR